MAELQTIRLSGTTQELVERVNTNFTEIENRKVDNELKTDSTTEYKVLSDNNLTDGLVTSIGDSASDRHTHSNKSLLDTYAQTEANLSDAVTKKHAHSNKALLDTYTQTEANIADAVTEKHLHDNKALLDTYSNTNADISDAISKEHTHSNKSVLDATTASYTTAEATKLSGIADGAEANVQANWNEATTTSDAYIQNKPTSLKNPYSVTIQKNATTIDTYDGSSAKTINITVPTTASDVGALPSSTKYGETIDLTYASDTGVLGLTLKDQDGTTLSTDSVDLPLELLIESGTVETCTVADVPVVGYVVGAKYIDLLLANDSHIYILVTDLVDQMTVSSSGSGNAITDITINGSVLTQTKGKTFVETSTTVNSKPLSSNITLGASDVGALPSSTKYANSLSISGKTVTLKDQDGTTLSTATTQDTTYSTATTSSNGLMSSGDKGKLDGIATGATKVEDSATNGNIKVNGTEVVVYTPEAVDSITEVSFTSDDAGWGALTNGVYTLTKANTKRPIVCYNSSNQVVMATLAYNGTNVTLVSDTKFAGKILTI